MATNYRQPGDVLDYTAGADIASGEFVALGDSIGVALNDIAGGSTGPVAVEGVFEVAKTAGTAWALGDKLDWDASASAFDKGLTAASGDIAGCAIAAADALAAATTATVKLANPGTVA